ncbi:Cuticle protein 6 [Amphibalanus amphitrite]|uniref:Cuticle protein 6 n=1 Tax=Amphibalanus amphitrite TaxID=1232801 RepID=A0A6A4W8Q2_AMPAM|nr:Cuticle protein 6 [Amphibalanus amphitrite]
MMSSVSVWLLSAVCAQLAAAQAPTQYNYPEFTGGYQAAGAAANRLPSAQTGGLAPAPRAAATGPGPYNAAAVAAGYNYPEFTGGYPARQQAPAQAYSPAPAAYNAAPAAYSPAQAAYNPAPAAYNPAAYSSAAAYDNNYSGGSAYDNGGYNDGYQSQSGPSHYNYGYASDTSAKQEVRSPDGTVRGAYSYIDANGRTQKVEYVSDSTGFHVVRGTNLPQAPAPPPTA